MTMSVTAPLAAPSAQLGAYLRPVDRLAGKSARAVLDSGRGLPLGGAMDSAFTLVQILRRDAGDADGMSGPILPVTALDTLEPMLRAQLARLAAPLASWAGLDPGRPHIMGVLNVTPDSFSDGGDFFADVARAVDQGRAMAAAGADIIDVGGESTRPGAAPVSATEEIDRVVPVVEKLSAAGIAVSIDTRHAAVMAAALDAGVRIVNDISGFADPDTLPLIVRRQVPNVIMHMQGEPGTMQAAPAYAAAPLDIFDYLAGRLDEAEAAGVPRALCLVDPGIGFGKTLTHNLDLMAMLGLYRSLGCGVLLGASRKSMVQHVMGGVVPPKARVPGSLALALAAVEGGASVIRVHDVAETVQALAVWQAVRARG